MPFLELTRYEPPAGGPATVLVNIASIERLEASPDTSGTLITLQSGARVLAQEDYQVLTAVLLQQGYGLGPVTARPTTWGT